MPKPNNSTTTNLNNELVAQLAEQTVQSRQLDEQIAHNLEELGYALPSQ
jgi:hypothetical protein